MARMTPALGAKGLYQLRAPWTIAGNTTIYTCIAIRSLDDFVDRGVDVLSKVYTPVQLDATALAADRTEGAMIITLASPNRPYIYVPDTYIEAYPTLDGVAYSHAVLSVDLGAIPDGLDLAFIKAQIQGVVEDSFGIIDATVNEHVAPSSGYVSQSQHQALETARNAAINNRETDRSQVLKLQVTVAAQAQKIQELEAIIRQLNPP